MRGRDERPGSLFSYANLEARVRGDHPLRAIRKIANAALNDLLRAFAALYTDFGRPSVAPEKLLCAMLLQAFYGILSERHLMERLEFGLLYRWFVGLGVEIRCGTIQPSPRTATGCWRGGRREVPALVLAQPNAGVQWRPKREAGQRRRLSMLSCAGWLPHDRGFVLGLPRSSLTESQNRRPESVMVEAWTISR